MYIQYLLRHGFTVNLIGKIAQNLSIIESTHHDWREGEGGECMNRKQEVNIIMISHRSELYTSEKVRD